MKQKTKQAASKRFSVTSRGKARRRRTHQAHFNSRETGGQQRKKHHDYPVHPSDMARLREVLPYLNS